MNWKNHALMRIDKNNWSRSLNFSKKKSIGGCSNSVIGTELVAVSGAGLGLFVSVFDPDFGGVDIGFECALGWSWKLTLELGFDLLSVFSIRILEVLI
jgi:hypothetical protein